MASEANRPSLCPKFNQRLLTSSDKDSELEFFGRALSPGPLGHRQSLSG